MDKKLTTKIQRISPKLPDASTNIANTLVIQPDDEVTLEKKGVIYTVFDISGKKPLDVLLVTKIVNDVLHDAYFQSESVSPIQSIEKSILKLRDNIGQIVKDESGADPMISFNIATTILWGTTLYIVQYGNTKTFLMRDGEVKPISSSSEGNFSVASGVVKDNDVVILATEDFYRRYPPEQLVSSSEIQLDEIGELQAAMIMKFMVEKQFSRSEVVDFGSKSTGTPKASEQVTTKRKFPKFKKPKIRDKGPKKQSSLIGLIALIILSALGVALYVSRDKILKNTEEIKQTMEKEVIIENENENIPQEAMEEPNPEQDRINKVVRVAPNLFYDIKLTDENADATDLLVVGDSLVAVDANNNAVYKSELEVPKFEGVNFAFGDITDPIVYNNNLAYFEDSELKVLDLATNTTVTTYAVRSARNLATYLDFFYATDENTIYRFDQEEDQLTENLWSTNETIQNAKDMAVNVSIFLISANDQLLRYTSGELDDFTVEGLDNEFSDAVSVITNTELEYMYIADAGNNRIVVLTDEGVLEKQYKSTEKDIWTNIEDIAVNQDETKLYVLDGNRIFEISLTN